LYLEFNNPLVDVVAHAHDSLISHTGWTK